MKSLSQTTNCEDSNCDWTKILGSSHVHDLWDYGHGDIRDMVCYYLHSVDSDDY